MSKWIPSIVAALAAIAAVFSPDVNAAVRDNPTAAAVVAGLLAVLNALFPSPFKKATPEAK